MQSHQMVKKTIVSPFICMHMGGISMQNHQILEKTIVSPLICMQKATEIMRQQRHIHGRQQRQIQAPAEAEGAWGFNPARAGIESLRQQRHIHAKPPNGQKDHSFPFHMYANGKHINAKPQNSQKDHSFPFHLYAKGYGNHATAEAYPWAGDSRGRSRPGRGCLGF